MTNLINIPTLIPLQLSHHGFWWEFLSLSSAVLAITLFAIAITAYKRHKLKRLFPLSLAFLFFVAKVGILHLDTLLPLLTAELTIASVAMEFGMLSMLLIAMVKK